MDSIYWYFILILILVLILPDDKRFLVIILSAGLSMLFLTYITLDYHYPLENESDVIEDDKLDKILSVQKNEKEQSENVDFIEKLMNKPYNTDIVDEYYEKTPYEAMFADYGLAKAQKRVLHNNDIMRENESKFQHNKFAPYFGDEMDISYEKVWFGVDT